MVPDAHQDRGVQSSTQPQYRVSWEVLLHNMRKEGALWGHPPSDMPHTVAKPPPSSGSGSLVTPTFEDNYHHHACQALFPIGGSEVLLVQFL